MRLPLSPCRKNLESPSCGEPSAAGNVDNMMSLWSAPGRGRDIEGLAKLWEVDWGVRDRPFEVHRWDIKAGIWRGFEGGILF